MAARIIHMPEEPSNPDEPPALECEVFAAERLVRLQEEEFRELAARAQELEAHLAKIMSPSTDPPASGA